ncbi:MAG: ABC-three component system protein [Methylocystis sp.]
MSGDQHDWQWQELQLRVRLAEADGDAFETLFQSVCKNLWGSAFQATIPMGRRGDLKCDGFHSATGCVYQCYGPRYGQANVSDALEKIEEDFNGAKDHWQDLMTKWVFVVGLYRDKIPSEMILLVFQLSKSLGVPAEIIGRDEIISLARDTTPDFRANALGLGRAPQQADMIRRVTYENIGRALAFIRADVTASPTEEINLPPDVDKKIAFNVLPHSVREFLIIGMRAADRVRHYILDHAEPSEAERMASGFSQRYRAVRENGTEPGDAFGQMLVFAGGGHPDPDREAAALAIVTHFFTTCEIFERPPEEIQ